MAAAILGGLRADSAKEDLFRRTLTGISSTDLEHRSQRFAVFHFTRKARPEIVARLRWHRSQGHRIAIVSASPECYIVPVGKLLGADAVIATKLEVDAVGNLTGSYEGSNCRGEQKQKRLRAWIDESGKPGFVWAYGNSRGDMRMLQGADAGIDVGKLGKLGRLRKFPKLSDVAVPERTIL